MDNPGARARSIARMGVGRKSREHSDNALGVIVTDHAITPPVLQQLRQLQSLQSVNAVRFE
jgi:hypothetical protein